MTEQEEAKKINPADYYAGLDLPVKMLFKRELIRQLGWSPETFQLRMRHKNFRPAERMMIDHIITTKSFLNV